MEPTMRTAFRLFVAAWLVLYASAPVHAEEEAEPWNAPLRKALAGCDRLEIRDGSGATPWVVTVEGTARVKEVADMIHLDPKASGPSCCCTGSVTFDFDRQGTRRATLTFHHGQSFRWRDGPWEGDGHLTRTSSLAVSRWLAERGAPGCLEELQHHIAGERTEARIRRRYAEILPPESAKALAKARRKAEEAMDWGDEYDAAELAALRAGTQTEGEFLRRLLTLYGCHEGTWSRYYLLDCRIEELLQEAAPADYAELFREIPENADLRNGLARILFNVPSRCPAPKEATAAALASIAPSALTHPRPANRRQAMAGLVHWGREASIPWLRQVFAGAIKPRPLPSGVGEKEGACTWSRHRSRHLAELGDASDRSAAAFFLAQLGDQESKPAIWKLHAESSGTDARVLMAALVRLVRLAEESE